MTCFVDVLQASLCSAKVSEQPGPRLQQSSSDEMASRFRSLLDVEFCGT